MSTFGNSLFEVHQIRYAYACLGRNPPSLGWSFRTCTLHRLIQFDERQIIRVKAWWIAHGKCDQSNAFSSKIYVNECISLSDSSIVLHVSIRPMQFQVPAPSNSVKKLTAVHDLNFPISIDTCRASLRVEHSRHFPSIPM